MLRVAVCDDECISREALLDILRLGIPGQKYSVREYPDGEKLIYEYGENQRPFDLILLDLEMPVLDGLETACRIRRIDRDVPIIIVTIHDEYTAWGYDIHAWHYLIKPVNVDKLRDVLLEITDARERKEKDCFTLSAGGVNIRIPFDRILYFESSRNFVSIHAIHFREPVRVYIPLCEVESLCKDYFIKTHHSFLVNKYHIECVSRKNHEAVLSNGEKIRVSRSKIRCVLEQIESRIYHDAQIT